MSGLEIEFLGVRTHNLKVSENETTNWREEISRMGQGDTSILLELTGNR